MKSETAAAQEAIADPFLDDVLEGLSAPAKFLPSKYFYDEIGSELYSEITRLPEYYPTRTETRLMRNIQNDLSRACAGVEAVVEFGSGSGQRSEILLCSVGTAKFYVPIDVSSQLLTHTRDTLARAHPLIRVVPVQADFMGDYQLPGAIPERRLGYFPGSTIGNFLPDQARQFLVNCRETLGSASRLLVGTDLVKCRTVLESAYDDAAGVTARFNKNLLHRINRELGADFDLDSFYHRAFYDPVFRRIEMHLVSEKDQTVQLSGIRRFYFRKGESIHTENSHKFTIDGFQKLIEEAGWQLDEHWVDENGWFAIHLMSAVG